MRVIVETQFLPPVEVFLYFAASSSIVIEACENYQKRSYRNRCHILTANGPLALSVPLRKGKNQQLPIKEVAIAYDQPWIETIQNKLQSSYGKSAFFEHYQDDLFNILERGHQKLFSLNLELLSFVLDKLDWNIKVVETKEYSRSYSEIDCDLREKYRPKTSRYVSKKDTFSYPQVFEYKFGFTGSLSILDLLFNLGPEAGLLLKSRAISPKI